MIDEKSLSPFETGELTPRTVRLDQMYATGVALAVGAEVARQGKGYEMFYEYATSGEDLINIKVKGLFDSYVPNIIKRGYDDKIESKIGFFERSERSKMPTNLRWEAKVQNPYLQVEAPPLSEPGDKKQTVQVSEIFLEQAGKVMRDALEGDLRTGTSPGATFAYAGNALEAKDFWWKILPQLDIVGRYRVSLIDTPDNLRAFDVLLGGAIDTLEAVYGSDKKTRKPQVALLLKEALGIEMK